MMANSKVPAAPGADGTEFMNRAAARNMTTIAPRLTSSPRPRARTQPLRPRSSQCPTVARNEAASRALSRLRVAMAAVQRSKEGMRPTKGRVGTPLITK